MIRKACAFISAGAIAVSAVTFGQTAPQGQAALDAAFQQFWNATTMADRVAAATAVVATGVPLDEALRRLEAGRRYDAAVPRGEVPLVNRTPAGEFPYTVDVPAAYAPERRYQVRVQLHGGVDRPASAPRRSPGIGALAGAEQIYVVPTAWREAPWWSATQLDNLRGILGALKRTYNVDENRIVLSGVSDGGTGAFYVAMRDSTPFASVLPLNGFIMILANPSLGLREGLYPQNLINKPFFVVNGGRDPLYPTVIVDPYITHLQRGGLRVAYRPQPEAAHNTAWWPEVKDEFEAFVREHPREPHPATITWETDGSPGTMRAHWLVIDELGTVGAAAALPDLNERVVGSAPNFGVRTAGMRIQTVLPGSNAEAFGFRPGDVVQAVNDRSLPDALDLLDYLGIFQSGERLTFRVLRSDTTDASGQAPVVLTGTYSPTTLPRTVPLFARRRPSGRVDVERSGNTIRATTRGVKTFTLLLSPAVFDLAAPITVIADGETVFEGRVAPSTATLLKWAAQDDDRTMLYTAELRIGR